MILIANLQRKFLCPVTNDIAPKKFLKCVMDIISKPQTEDLKKERIINSLEMIFMY